MTARARKAVIHVRGQVQARGGRGESGTAVGSGFIIDRAGFIITNEHVIRDASDLVVQLQDGHELPACVVGDDETTDVALLKIDSLRPLPVLPLGDSDALSVGESVIAIGSPFGFSNSVTAGVVSAKDRVLGSKGGADAASAKGDAPYAFFIQTDASINVGNSGGPLIDAQGAVVGVNAAYWGGSQPSQGIGFAIPINIVKLLLPELRLRGSALRSELGADFQILSSDLADAFQVPPGRGALIAFVEPGSAAAVAALQAGDVITTWNHRALAGREDFRIWVQLSTPGEKVPVTLLRGGHWIERTVIPKAISRETRPRHRSACGRDKGPSVARDGRSAVGVELKERMIKGQRVLEIETVVGLLGEAAPRPKDQIVRVGKHAVATEEEFWKQITDGPPGRPSAVLVKREGSPFWVALPPLGRLLPIKTTPEQGR